MISQLIDIQEFNKHRTDDNIVITITMTVKGEEFSNAIVVDDYKNKCEEEITCDIDYGFNGIRHMYHSVLRNREDLFDE